jgi:hypothetical protein
VAGILHVDAERLRVTVQAGMRAVDFLDAIAQHGLALENMASVDVQTLGGLIATASHGSGATLRSLSASVVKLHVVTARPGAPAFELHAQGGALLPEGAAPGCPRVPADAADVAQDELAAWFSSGRAGLGALGVVVAIQFQCVPAYRLVSEEFVVKTAHILDPILTAHASPYERALPDSVGLREVFRAYEFGKIWVVPHTTTSLVHAIQRADPDKHPWAANVRCFGDLVGG